MSRKRANEDIVSAPVVSPPLQKLPILTVSKASLYDDPNELINAVISVLAVPESKTAVSEVYANDKNLATEVQAYAKIAGNNWTFYVKNLSISIGRNTDTEDNSVDIDLGPAKVVSRQHASISYNLNSRFWELQVNGRNGAKVDNIRIPCGPNSKATPLYSGAVIDIGGSQMMFILPDAQPKISNNILDMLSSKLPKPKKQRLSLTKELQNNNISHSASNGRSSNMSNGSSNNLKGFQMFSNEDGLNPLNNSNLNFNNLDNDLSKPESKDIKPPFSYATMITQAILSNPEGVLSLSEIYDWISDHYAFYRFSRTGWQNSIRHNLSLNKAFEKVPRRSDEPGKGMKWQISDSYKKEFLTKFQNGSLSKVRRGSSVSRQLQLHLATHNDLPASQSARRKIPPSYTAGTTTTTTGNDSTSNGAVPQIKPTANPYFQYQAPTPSAQPQSQSQSPVQTQPQPQPQPPSAQYGYTSLPPLQPIQQPQSSPIKPEDSQTLKNASQLSSPIKPATAETSSPVKTPSKFYNQFENANSANLTTNGGANSNNNGNSISPIKNFNNETFTPERGARKSGDLQSSPALWNFVQFSTPLGGGNGTGASSGATAATTASTAVPTTTATTTAPGTANDRDKGSPTMGDLRNVDLAKGFKKN